MIRVLIERFFEEDMEEELRDVELAARQKAMQIPGYISGETLKNKGNPQHNVVISTWRSVEEWDQWHTSDAWKSILEELQPMLVEPEKITVLEPL